ncbi:AadS family aminoglycoside 6-adenylyltransferase [Pedobacter chitinilyticus]|uniref:AadS family aminoglycoside 6-adenylyltransferase n=1 Tax=Pedobacter chitinilyticus TaxID=2233776 RepID=A0A443Z038_9SPHI|nr:AadS family aminoglycoside 6-adenylyltransferase [Pedobacter chitinilyticus]RWU09921.1 AadS family aminoglycoside 6-adenylyltransferase [Pedobacter chitinilyticus]
MEKRGQKLQDIINWAKKNEEVRALLLTSSLVNPLAPVDEFSDLDIEVIFEDNASYVHNSLWLNLFGTPIAVLEEDDACFEGKHAMKMVLYEDHVKVDFKLFSKIQFVAETQLEQLPEDWDIGYQVLLDKDDITSFLKKPSYQVSIIKKPVIEEFQRILNDFWWDTTYVAKCLARGDLFYAKFMSEDNIRTAYLVPLIEWYIASQHQWNITTNKHGRLFKKYLSDKEWQMVEATFSGSDVDENWKALFAMADLVNKMGTLLSEKLETSYPIELELKIRTYLRQVRAGY